MTSDSTPVFALEKEALKTEIETGLQVGVDHLEDKPMKRKPVEKYHNTRHLLKQYRKVSYAIQISESDMNVRMEMEHGTRLSTLEVNAELAGVDLSGSKLEGYARTVIRSKNMLQIIKNALNTVRLDPDHGELMYQILYTIDEATRSQTIVVNPDDLQTLIVYNVPAGGLQIIKSDADTGERLGGVKFEIRKINGEILGTYTTDRDGVISIPNAESGWYTIVERKAKDGYALDTTPVNACVKDSETTTVEITNQRMASIMIHKIDAATGAGIYGVKFVLYDSGKNPIGEYTTDQDGYIYIDDELVPGKYYLRELEAADGYIRDEQYKTVYVERGKCAQIEWENSAVTGQIQIRKYSSEDNTVTGQLAGTPLEGAVFEITQARSGKVVGYIVTDARGVAASGPLPLGRYFVTEVSAPKYYQLSGEKMEAEIEYPSQIIKLSAYNKPAALGVTIKKSGNYEVQSGQAMSYDFSGIANTSNVALNHFFWHDRIPTDATRALSISTGTYNARLYYKVTFKTNLNDYRTLASNLLTANNYSLSLNAATLRLVQGEYITDVRFEFGTVPSGFSSVVKPTMRVQVLGTVSNGYQIINRADVGGQYLNEWQTAKTTWVTTVRRFNTTPLPKTGY